MPMLVKKQEISDPANLKMNQKSHNTEASEEPFGVEKWDMGTKDTPLLPKEDMDLEYAEK